MFVFTANRNTKSKIKESSKGALLWKTVAAKMLTDNGSNSDSKNIPFQYKETPEGHFDITYIPKCAGIYEGNNIKILCLFYRFCRCFTYHMLMLTECIVCKQALWECIHCIQWKPLGIIRTRVFERIT